MNRPMDPTLEDVDLIKGTPDQPVEPQQSPGDAHRPIGLDPEDGGPGIAAEIPEEALLADELDHDGLDDGDDQFVVPVKPGDPSGQAQIKDRPSKWGGVI